MIEGVNTNYQIWPFLNWIKCERITFYEKQEQTVLQRTAFYKRQAQSKSNFILMPGPMFVNDLAPVKCKVKGNSNDFVHNTVFFMNLKRRYIFPRVQFFFFFKD